MLTIVEKIKRFQVFLKLFPKSLEFFLAELALDHVGEAA
jgi:hypothetical protein